MIKRPTTLTGVVVADRYRVEERIALGGMGEVYRASRVPVNKTVAIKFLHADFAKDTEFRQRFEREVRVMSQLDHPNCVSVIDFGVHEDTPFVVMEYVDGNTLKEMVTEGALSVERALHLGRQLLAGLAHAHSQGVVHRDVKSANIIIANHTGTGDFVKILDFGLAKFLASEGHDISQAGFVIGTPSYMSPEQAVGGDVDARSDVYCAGIVLFELLTGRRPFETEDVQQMLSLQRQGKPPTLNEAAPDCEFPEGLEEVIATALAKSPDSRYASAIEFAQALGAIVAEGAFDSGPGGFTVNTIEYTPPGKKAKRRASSTPRASAPATRRRRISRSLVVLLIVATASSAAAMEYFGVGVDEVVSSSQELYRYAVAQLAESGEPVTDTALPAESPSQPSQPAQPAPVAEVDVAPVSDAQVAAVSMDASIAAVPDGGGEENGTVTEELAEGGDEDDIDDEEGDDGGDTEDGDDDEADIEDGDGDDEADSEEGEGGLGDRAPLAEPSTPRTLAQVQARIRAGDHAQAIAGLNYLARKNPKRAYVFYLRGNLYFERTWWTDALKSYSQALKLDRSYRRRGTLIKNVIRTLGSPKTSARATYILTKLVGRPALSHLRRAASRDKSPVVRKKAERLAVKIKGRKARR